MSVYSPGNYGALCPCVMVDLKGLDAVGESYGMLLMFMGISNLMGAPLGGFLYDICGSFSPPFVLHGLFLVGSGVIVLPLLCKKDRKQ
ncbi:monocarboxylate transporter 12 [Elysia marginata]|uniref:Monocarboxylate transporter 12 n=1 Tax=Elysia marginata TaxID=1093978 RepID=A0AAV4IR15_9GAST|nr:monocarboxylate transporter 12 [Elysia marginata]